MEWDGGVEWMVSVFWFGERINGWVLWKGFGVVAVRNEVIG